jgi:hypothetical protein
MKVVAVYLTRDGRRAPAPVALFPVDDFAKAPEEVKRYLDLFHPGEPFEVEELDVSVQRPQGS